MDERRTGGPDRVSDGVEDAALRHWRLPTGGLRARFARRGRSSKDTAAVVLLVAMAMALSFVELPLIPWAPWLKYDASSAVAVLSSLLYGPWVGVGIAACSWIPHLVADPLGAFMNIMAASSLALATAALWRPSASTARSIAACAAGVAASTALSVCLNFVVTPLYLGVSYEYVAGLVLPALVPFNVAKAAINGAIAVVFVRKVNELLEGPASA